MNVVETRLDPGALYVAGETTGAAEVCVTVLGSCVSACARDPALGVGGMNHFLLPRAPLLVPAAERFRYGDLALRHLIDAIVAMGGSRARLEVKLVGGGEMVSPRSAAAARASIGAQNIAAARAFFASLGVPVVAEDTGGEHPRLVRYFPRTGRMMVRRLPPLAAALEAAR